MLTVYLNNTANSVPVRRMHSWGKKSLLTVRTVQNVSTLRGKTRFVGAFEKLRKTTVSFVMSVCLSVCPSAWNNSAPSGRIFMKFDISVFLENLTRITGSVHEDRCTLFIIPRSILLRMRSISDKMFRENWNTQFMFNSLFRKSCRLCDNVEKHCRAGEATDDSNDACTLHAGRLSLHTHTQNMLCNTTAFPLQQCLHERLTRGIFVNAAWLGELWPRCHITWKIKWDIHIAVSVLSVRCCRSWQHLLYPRHEDRLERRRVTALILFASFLLPAGEGAPDEAG